MDPPMKVRTKPARLSVLVGPELYDRLDAYRRSTGVQLSKLGALMLERAMDEFDGAQGDPAKPAVHYEPAQSA